jgi:hypothetical protein
LSPPIAQEEVDGNNNCLWAVVDKTGRQKTMDVGGTGRKGKERRGGITLFNQVIDINALYNLYFIQHTESQFHVASLTRRR